MSGKVSLTFALQEIFNWIQDDADDFARTITSRLGQVDWSRIGSVAMWSALRGAIDQLTFVRSLPGVPRVGPDLRLTTWNDIIFRVGSYPIDNQCRIQS